MQMHSIVVIEKDPIARRRIQAILKQAGYQVRIAKTIERGMTLLNDYCPALILLDWDIPNPSQCCAQIKSHPKLTHSYLICLSPNANVSDRIRGLNAGADECLSKPIVEAELMARVQAGLRIYQLHKEMEAQNQLIQAHNLRLKTELEEATQYMRSHLPAPMNSPVSIDFRFIPSQHLGGDCFDYFWVTPSDLAIYLLDVSGHGMGATLMAMSILNELRNQTQTSNLLEPQTILQTLNKQVQINERHSKYFTIWYGIYHHSNHTLTYASAGHPPALLMADSKIKPLKTPGPPIGLLPNPTYQSQTCKISPHSTLYLFSDGIYEFPAHDGQIWGLRAFQDFMSQSQQLPLDEVIQTLQTSYASHQFLDDLSILQINFRSLSSSQDEQSNNRQSNRSATPSTRA